MLVDGEVIDGKGDVVVVVVVVDLSGSSQVNLGCLVSDTRSIV